MSLSQYVNRYVFLEKDVLSKYICSKFIEFDNEHRPRDMSVEFLMCEGHTNGTLFCRFFSILNDLVLKYLKVAGHITYNLKSMNILDVSTINIANKNTNNSNIIGIAPLKQKITIQFVLKHEYVVNVGDVIFIPNEWMFANSISCDDNSNILFFTFSIRNNEINLMTL